MKGKNRLDKNGLDKNRLDNLPLRAVAARLLARLRVGRGSLSEALPEADSVLSDGRDRAMLRLLLYQTLRTLYRREAALALLLQRPLAAPAKEVEALLLLGLTQLDQGIDGDYAVVDASVEAARALGHPQLAGLVNALLRRASRESSSLYANVLTNDQHRFDHPQWLIDRIRADWGDKSEMILRANNARAPLWLRTNRLLCERDALAEYLHAAGVQSSPHPFLPDALQVKVSGDVADVAGWREGKFSVQDAAAQAAVELLDLKPGLSVLDACTAPGGKLAHIAEREPRLQLLLGLDSDGKRLERTREAMVRLGVRPALKQADAAIVTDWWQGVPFDRILLDAPCSGTGVIRRHPDIRLLRRDTDIGELVKKQSRLLEALWPLLAPGGRLVYATCSILKDENEHQIAAFLSRHPEARVRTGEPHWFGTVAALGSQNLPGEGDADGFFYAVLEQKD